MEGQKGEKPADNHVGEKIRACLESAPDMMAELMREYILNRDLNSRVKVRLRIKALLDLAGVDTVFPGRSSLPIAAQRPGPFAVPAVPQFADAQVEAPMDIRGEVDRRLAAGMNRDIQPVPGAEPIDNADILG